ncbi:MAG: hypothetical protein ACLU6Y_08875 [Ruminococcus sp.]
MIPVQRIIRLNGTGQISRHLHPFGDGAGAVVLVAEEGGKYAQVTQSIGKKGGALTLRSRNQIQYETDPKAKETYIQMNGKEVFTFAVSKVRRQ